MATNKQPDDGIDQLVDRLTRTSEQLAKSSEEQIRQLEGRVKTFLDRNEKATEDFIARIDKEVRAQMVSLRREIEQLQRRLADFVKSTKKASAKKKAGMKKKAAAKKKAPAKKKATKQRAAAKKKAAARR